MRDLGCDLHYTITYTTRSQRANERHGVDYFFVSRSTFEEMLHKGDLLEYAEVYGNWYGIPKSQVQSAFARGKDVIIKTDVQGAATIKRLAPKAVMVFLAPPSMQELERRLRWRMTESQHDLMVRIRTAREEMTKLPLFDYVVMNDKLDEAISQIKAIIAAEKCRVPPRIVKL